jgi:2'-5' RNA ligase
MTAASRAQQGIHLIPYFKASAKIDQFPELLDKKISLPYTDAMQPATLRTFLACPISSENLIQIERLLALLQAGTPNAVKWVNSHNLHLTINFMGEFKQSDVAELKDQLSTSLENFSAFSAGIAKLGAFPSIDNPKVIWLGLEAGPALFDLVKVVRSQCDRVGYPPEKRPFAAHITIGRLRPTAIPSDKHAIGAAINAHQSVTIGQQRFDTLHFYKSELTPSGPIYKILFSIPLAS